MSETPRRTGGKRLLLAAGMVMGCLSLMTAAVLTDLGETHVQIDGKNNHLDILVAGSADRTWTAKNIDWEQGNTSAYQVIVSDDDDGYLMHPGTSLDVRVAVKNNSPQLAGTLHLSLFDPNPQGDARDPETGTYVELFHQLIFTVRDGEEILLDRVKSSELRTVTWNEPLLAGASKTLDVTIGMNPAADNRWQRASTGVQFHFEAESR